MLKIHQLFFIQFISLFIGTLLIASIIGYLTLRSLIVDQTTKDLKNSLLLLEANMHSAKDLESFTKKSHSLTHLRITLIDKAGKVLAESNHKVEGMENHANRSEVMMSAREEFGISLRYSHTIGTDFLYVAKRTMYQGQQITLRVSDSMERILASFTTITSRMVFAFLFFIILAIIISYKLSQKINEDVSQLIEYLDQISNKNYKAVIKTRHFSEFLRISLQLKSLVKKLSDRERQKRKYTAKLRLVNKQRNDILSAISHEFKNPIASIMGYTETLYDEPDLDIKIRKKFLGKIFSNSKKITQMLDRLSLSVKLENNDMKIKKVDFDLCDLCQEVVQNLSKKYKNRTITHDCVKTEVFADKTTLELVLINLVDNAMKYSEENVSIIIKDDHLHVYDRGMGIAPVELEKITSKYYRVKKNSWDNSMGLGLSIVSYILHMHKSALKIESEVGVGSDFGFDIRPILKDIPTKAEPVQ